MVKLISIMPEAEKIIAYCARVSSPNQNNPEIDKLLKYLITHKHWSPFEQASMVVEIETTRGIAPQILRHRSFSFQEFSQRYAQATEFEEINPRRQDIKNRQNSLDDLDEDTKDWFKTNVEWINSEAHYLYKKALEKGISKESARFLLPLNTKTKLYMNGTIRSFIHYVQVRTDPSTQLEHREIAQAIKDIMIKELPTISKALGWI